MILNLVTQNMMQTTMMKMMNLKLHQRMKIQKNMPSWDLREEDSITIEGEAEDSEASAEATVAFKHVRA